MRDGGRGRRGRAAPPAGGIACRQKSCSPLPPGAVHPTANTQVGRSYGWVSPRSGVPHCHPWTHGPGFPRGTGSPAQRGLPQLAPRPGRCPSVCLGCEDEESVFLLADPFHELVDSADGTGLRPQGTVAYVELEGAGDLGGKKQGTRWAHVRAPLGAGTASSPHGHWEQAQGLQREDTRWQQGTLNAWHLVCSEVGGPNPKVCHQSGFSLWHCGVHDSVWHSPWCWSSLALAATPGHPSLAQGYLGAAGPPKGPCTGWGPPWGPQSWHCVVPPPPYPTTQDCRTWAHPNPTARPYPSQEVLTGAREVDVLQGARRVVSPAVEVLVEPQEPLLLLLPHIGCLNLRAAGTQHPVSPPWRRLGRAPRHGLGPMVARAPHLVKSPELLDL